MATSTVELQKMKSAAAELEKIYTSMQTQLKKLGENVSSLKGIWSGEASTVYINGYQQNAAEINNLAQAIKSAATALTSIAANYQKADSNAAEIIKQKLAKG